MIRAEVHSDDHRATADFDATPYFEQASLEELQGLARIGWGVDYEADAVALFLEDRDEGVGRVFTYLSFGPTMPYSGDRVGFECHVVEADAARWVKANRPGWFDAIWPDGVATPEPNPEPDHEVGQGGL